MKKEILETAGYCGLACKSCSIYIASRVGGETLERRARKGGMTADAMYCKGCRSDKTSPYCTECKIKECIRGKALQWCSQCADYPCEMLKNFENSLPHRSEVLRSLDFAKAHTLEEWEEEMHKDFSCTACGAYTSVYADGCHVCDNKTANAFAERHWDCIKDSPERDLVK